MERRKFLIGAAITACQIAKNPFDAIAQISQTKSQQSPTDNDSLTPYLETISFERRIFEPIAARRGIMDGIKRLTPQETTEDFNMYFPMYRAGQFKYGVPWQLLWIIHEHETAASRDSNPGGSNYVGAMQLDRAHYTKTEISSAPNGFEGLDTLPQRYHPRLGFRTKDWEEILRAAGFIEWQRSIRGYPEGEQGQLEVVRRNYSDAESAAARIRKFNELKEMMPV